MDLCSTLPHPTCSKNPGSSRQPGGLSVNRLSHTSFGKAANIEHSSHENGGRQGNWPGSCEPGHYNGYLGAAIA